MSVFHHSEQQNKGKTLLQPVAKGSTATARPGSAVSELTGLIGLMAFFASLYLCNIFELKPSLALLMLLVGTALPMIVSSFLVDRVHLNKHSALDYSLCHPWSRVIPVTLTKLIGLAATFAVIALAYSVFRNYQHPDFTAYFHILAVLAPAIWIVSPLYIAFTTRHMQNPEDDLWHFGKLILCDFKSVDPEKIKNHCLSWLVKAFFLAFMISIFPKILGGVLYSHFDDIDSTLIVFFLITLKITFLVDVCFGSIGYIFTLKIFDSHIRSANPHLSAWVAALICYPPFAIMVANGPLDYKSGSREWLEWFAGEPVILAIWGSLILALALIYAWATVAFGIRFSNLTNRGILTNGPYRFVRHPAYLSKNLLWWMIFMPFLSQSGPLDALQNSLLLLVVNAIYFARARTEERHLLTDPDYRAYSGWISENGLFARLKKWRPAE
ncbi:methyltransferase family protein [Kiloniella sp. b19]|uniref:methyltransferase family protein n=1 Tax=Kiloniella sp. GXU_MW_B19 TaxID=3141326 RepID=UPI0031DE33DD